VLVETGEVGVADVVAVAGIDTAGEPVEAVPLAVVAGSTPEVDDESGAALEAASAGVLAPSGWPPRKTTDSSARTPRKAPSATKRARRNTKLKPFPR
jgi:hypothetical protein